MPGIDSCSVEPTAPSYLRLTAWIAIRPAGENTAMISYNMDTTDHVYYSHDPGALWEQPMDAWDRFL